MNPHTYSGDQLVKLRLTLDHKESHDLIRMHSLQLLHRQPNGLLASHNDLDFILGEDLQRAGLPNMRARVLGGPELACTTRHERHVAVLWRR